MNKIPKGIYEQLNHYGISLPKNHPGKLYKVYRTKLGKAHLLTECFRGGPTHPEPTTESYDQFVDQLECELCVLDSVTGSDDAIRKWVENYVDVQNLASQLSRAAFGAAEPDPVALLYRCVSIRILPSRPEIVKVLAQLIRHLHKFDPEITGLLNAEDHIRHLRSSVEALMAASQRFNDAPLEKKREVTNRYLLINNWLPDPGEVTPGESGLSNHTRDTWRAIVRTHGPQEAATAAVARQIVMKSTPNSLEALWQRSNTFGAYDGHGSFESWAVNQWREAVLPEIENQLQDWSAEFISATPPPDYDEYALVLFPNWGLDDRKIDLLRHYPHYWTEGEALRGSNLICQLPVELSRAVGTRHFARVGSMPWDEDLAKVAHMLSANSVTSWEESVANALAVVGEEVSAVN